MIDPRITNWATRIVPNCELRYCSHRQNLHFGEYKLHSSSLHGRLSFELKRDVFRVISDLNYCDSSVFNFSFVSTSEVATLKMSKFSSATPRESASLESVKVFPFASVNPVVQ